MGIELSLPDFRTKGSVDGLLPSWFRRDILEPDVDMVPAAPAPADDDDCDGPLIDSDMDEQEVEADTVHLMPCALTVAGLQHIVNNLCAD
eukprot:7182175-Heterocapsa_arctica.AAC.1